MKPSHAQNEAKPLSTSVFNNFLITSQFESSRKYVPFYYWSKICPVENMSCRKYVPSKKCPSKKCPSKKCPGASESRSISTEMIKMSKQVYLEQSIRTNYSIHVLSCRSQVNNEPRKATRDHFLKLFVLHKLPSGKTAKRTNNHL